MKVHIEQQQRGELLIRICIIRWVASPSLSQQGTLRAATALSPLLTPLVYLTRQGPHRDSFLYCLNIPFSDTGLVATQSSVLSRSDPRILGSLIAESNLKLFCKTQIELSLEYFNSICKLRANGSTRCIKYMIWPLGPSSEGGMYEYTSSNCRSAARCTKN